MDGVQSSKWVQQKKIREKPISILEKISLIIIVNMYVRLKEQ